MIVFPNLNSDVGLKSLDEHLRTRYYISNFKATKDDITVYAALSKPPAPQYVNVVRWYNQIQTLLSISGISCEGSGVTITEVASVPKERTTPSWESWVMIITPDNNEIDMKKLEVYIRSFQMEGMFWGPSKLVSFGYGVNILRIIFTMYDDLEIDNQDILCDHVFDYAKGFSIETIGLHEILMLIKPNNETDMEKVEEAVRSIQVEGLYWGESKLVPVGYGINLLGIECIASRYPRGFEKLDTAVKEILVNQHVQSCHSIELNSRIRTSEVTYKESDSKYIMDHDAEEETEEEKETASSSGKSRLMFLVQDRGNRDVKKVEENLRSIEKEGVVWGTSKYVNVGYGCKYLRIIVTVEDKVFPDSKFDRNICAQTIVREKGALGYDVVVSRIITLNKTYDGENSRGEALM